MDNAIEIYQTDEHTIEVRLDQQQETIWLNRQQIANLFERDVKTIGKHVNNVFREGELDKAATVAKFATVQTEGARSIERQVEYYNLDVIISIGYRVKSLQGVKFRQWATKRLKDYLVKGYTLNQQRFEHNATALQQALLLIQKTAQSPELTAEAGSGLVDIVSRYTHTFLWLQQYDEGLLDEPNGEAGGQLPSAEQAMISLNQLKQDLIARGEATDLFAKLRDDGLSAILGNLDQSVFGEPAYPTIESKAAHLLYFVVKNHPFSDGNKRSGAFLFVDFLHRNQRLLNANGDAVINDTGLAALTLLVAESNPNQKETIIKLVMTMLAPQVVKPT